MADKDKTEKYAYLDQLSTEALEELLCADIESPEDNDDEVVFHILEVIRQREQNDSIEDTFDVDKAWTEFKQYYNTPEGEGLILYPVDDEENYLDGGEDAPTSEQPKRTKAIHLSHALKMAGIVAAIIICMFSLMLGVQAAGIDIFGAIGRWTNETFHFTTSSAPIDTHKDASDSLSSTHTQKNKDYYDLLKGALNKCGIPEKLAPTIYPDGFDMSTLKVSDTDFGNKIYCAFNGDEDRFFSIQVLRYDLASDLNLHTFEKDNTIVTEYTTGERTFYIMSNLDTLKATWSNGYSLVVEITGSISEDAIKEMIDSIGD